jgi:hypothetical protein
MKIIVLRISSPDLYPEVAGVPDTLDDFDIRVEVMLAQEGYEGDDISFNFSVVSPSALLRRPCGQFIQNTLLLSEFSWADITRHIERLLMQIYSCHSWECIALRLSPYMLPLAVTLNETAF